MQKLHLEAKKKFLAFIVNFWTKTKFTRENIFVSKCNFCKRNHWTFKENIDKNQWVLRICPVLMAAWLYPTYSNLSSAQCCVFNNSSIVKHRHQIWDQFVIPVFKTEITNWSWILPQFTSLIRKLALVFFFDGFLGFRKKKFFQPSFRKKITFYI